MNKKSVFLILGIIIFSVVGIILSFFIIFSGNLKKTENVTILNENIVNVLDATCGSGKILDARLESGVISLIDGINVIKSNITSAKAIYAISTDSCVKNHILYIDNDGSLKYTIVNFQSNIFEDNIYTLANGNYIGFVKEIIKNDGKYIRVLDSNNNTIDILVIKY